ncbi:MAG: hypothetical protein WC741_03920 [Patescibacteria group bacterium]|jgi:hypothetical protein
MVYRNKISNIKYQLSKRSSVIFIFLLICLFYYLFKSITSSVFLKGRDKINVVFYGEKTRFYSLDRKNVNYLLSFSNSLKVTVPGGYDKYIIGAIGKLASLEKKPDIFKKTFSAATSTFVDLYFYQKKTVVYYDDFNLRPMPTFMEILLTDSNANLIDKLFLVYIFSTNNKENFQSIDLSPFKLEGDNNIFDYNLFYKKFQGSFFQRTYRKYDINVQIVYTNSYKTAQLIGQMIEGEGIRVVDLSDQGKKNSGCLLIADKKIIITKTFERLAEFFKCRTQVGETTVSDIILELGDLEKEWAVN